MKTPIIFRSFYFWMITITIILNVLFSKFPALSTGFYTEGVFQVIRFIYDYTLAYLPFPFIYVALGIVFFYIIRWILQFRLVKGWKFNLTHFVIGIFKLLSSLICLFYFLWGFNYHSDSLKTRLKLTDQKISKQYLEKEIKEVEELLLDTRTLFIADSLLITQKDIPSDFEKIIREAQKTVLPIFNLPYSKRARVRKLKPDGFLLRFSTAGIYIPHSLEGHIDGGLHPIQWPATMAHEMGHGHSITDEGECNFIGLITCTSTASPVIQYSGLFMYYRYLVNNYQRGFMEQGKAYQIPEIIQRDINDCRKYSSRYPDIFPAARDVIYDQYLKSHGIKEGLDSYNTIVQMMANFKRLQRQK